MKFSPSRSITYQRDDFTPNSYSKGKELGANGCIDARCLAVWHPFLAPAHARLLEYRPSVSGRSCRLTAHPSV